MLVVDTSAWIEWLVQSEAGQRLNACFPSRDHQLVPTIVQFELTVWALRELPEAKAQSVIAASQEMIAVPLDTWIALSAAHIRRSSKLPTADSIIYATALANDADLLTCDAHFENLPHVLYIPKFSG